MRATDLQISAQQGLLRTELSSVVGALPSLMKKLSPRFRKWLAYRQRRAWRQRSVQWLLRSKSVQQATSEAAPFPQFYKGVSGALCLRAPANLSFSTNYDEVALFLQALRDLRYYAAVGKLKRVEVDFTTIRYLGPAAALCLVSELDRWRLVRSLTLKPLKLDDWDPQVRRLLLEMGFFDVLEVVPPLEGEALEGVDRWIRFRSGTNNAGDLARQVRIEVEKIRDPFPHKLALFEALTEAIANAVEHAYPDDAPASILNPKLGKRWWLSGSIDHKTSNIRVTFYDQGITIPQALPRKTFWEKVRGLMVSRECSQTS
jgi:hypothetical protein